MRALGFEPKKEEIKKMISDIDKDGSGTSTCLSFPSPARHLPTHPSLRPPPPPLPGPPVTNLYVHS